MAKSLFPIDPLAQFITTPEYRRSVIVGILECYNSNYDFLVEAIQNAIDALEDAKLLDDLPAPFLLDITIDLKHNSVSILDTGIGMTQEQIAQAFTPNLSSKTDPALRAKRGPLNPYRGYKGVGLTFLSYGSDDISFHSKRNGGSLIKTKMQYGHMWAVGEREDSAVIDSDKCDSPLDKHARGTYIKIQFSKTTRPKSLAKMAGDMETWGAIIRTRTAAGQVLLGRQAQIPIKIKLNFVSTSGTQESMDLSPTFLYPHEIRDMPPHRFLDVYEYHRTHPELGDTPREVRRQDGIYMIWDTDKIKEEFTENEREQFIDELVTYKPYLYAFVPYHAIIWDKLNALSCPSGNSKVLSPGLIIAINCQRLADKSEFDVTRSETFARNVFVAVHFSDAKPDGGRKTVQEEVSGLAKAAANRAAQYFYKQRNTFLRPAGDDPTEDQRQVEKNHQDWLISVKLHEKTSPLALSPITLASTPLTEQDVIGLFHQLTVTGVFPGIKVYATSQTRTYDCLIEFECPSDSAGLKFASVSKNPLGLSGYVIGKGKKFHTPNLTLEFKSNLDGLISDIEDPDSPKKFVSINVCVCWGVVKDKFKGYELIEITDKDLDQRSLPGSTHILRHNGEKHVIQVVMLKRVVEMIQAGQITLS